MLVKCERHTYKDLGAWQKYEEADAIHAEKIGAKTDKACKAIRDFLLLGECYFSTSWGKDSTVAIHLAHTILGLGFRVWNIRVVPNRNPYCDIVRDVFLNKYKCNYYEVVIDYTYIIKARLTLDDYNKETDKLWRGAIKQISKEAGTARHCLGVRADESNVRLLRCLRWKNNSPNGCAPLAWWSAADVFAYLHKFNLPVHPNYAMLGGGRWDRHYLRVAEIGDSHGRGIGRDEWEKEYYSDILRRCGYVNY